MEDNRLEKEKIDKIKRIVEKEIEKELINKQNEVSEISEKIKNVLRNLEVLKYVVAVSYYDENPVLTSKKGQDEGNEEEKAQMQIHPCVKKLAPYRGAYEKALGNGCHTYETRKNKRSEDKLEGSLKGLEVKREPQEEEEKVVKKCDMRGNVRMPQYIPPLPNGDEEVSSVNSTGGDDSKERFRVVVGNVSKWIPPDMREDNSTHKWMVYIRNKEEGRDVTKHLKKVRYFLHESYKPHDIIDVTSPYQLTRRGWGEFPVRVQLHFLHPANKPVDIIHKLKLDMTCSGVQMLGGETVVEICLHAGAGSKERKREVEGKGVEGKRGEEVREEGQREKQDVFDGELLLSMNGMRMEDEGRETGEREVKIEDAEGSEESGRGALERRVMEMKCALWSSRKLLGDRERALRTVEIEHDYMGPGEKVREHCVKDLAKCILKGDVGREGERALKNGVLLDYRDMGGRIGYRESEEEVLKRLKSALKKEEADGQSKQSLRVFRHAYLVNILQRAQASGLKSVESLLRWFVQRWPVITKLSVDPVYKMIHPYSCPSEAEFFRYSVGKQRSAEWFRAKAIQKVLKSLKSLIPIEEEIWTTKQILLWCRFHGYFPVSTSSSLSASPATSSAPPSTSTNFQIKNEPGSRSYDSSSDSEDGLDKALNLKMATSPYLNGIGVKERKKNFKKSRKKDAGGKERGGRTTDYREINTFTENQCDSTRFGYNDYRTLQTEEDFTIDVVGIHTEKGSPTKRIKSINIKVETIRPDEIVFNRFVCETARQMGAKITPEELVPGVLCDSVSQVLARSVSSFLEDLLRRSCARAWIRNGERCPESLEMNDVLATLIEHPQFDVFTNRGLGQQMPGTSNT